MVKLAMEGHRFQRLEVDASLALKMFEDNHYKTLQIPHIAAQSSTGSILQLNFISYYLHLPADHNPMSMFLRLSEFEICRSVTQT